MKKIIALILALVLFSLPVSAEDIQPELTLTLTEGITLYGEGDEVLGMNKEQFKEYIEKNNLILYGVADDNSFVIEISGEETQYSKSVKDFNNLKLSDIKDFADNTKILSYNIEQLGEAIYIIREISQAPSDLVETTAAVTQYITVKQEKIYVVTVTAANTVDKEKKKSLVAGIDYSFSEIPPSVSVWQIVIVSGAIILVLVVMAWLIVTLVKDIKKRKNKQINSEKTEEKEE